MSAAAPHGPFASERPAIAGSGERLQRVRQFASDYKVPIREIHNQRPGEPGLPLAPCGADRLSLARWTLVNGVRERSFGLRHLTFEPCDVRVQALMHEVGRASETVFLPPSASR